MALVKVKQFFMSNENIAEEKRGSMYALYMTEVYAGKAAQPQMIKGVGYAEEADLLAFCERHAPVDERLVKLSVFHKQHPQITEGTLWSYAKSGKLKTAQKINGRWYIDREEAERFARQLENRGEQKSLKSEFKQQGYISAQEYAAMHQIDYQQFLRQLKEGLFPFEKADDVYLIAKDTPFVRYISLNNYAKEHDIPYTKVKRAADNELLKTAVKANNGRWYIDAEEEPAFRYVL